MLDMTLSVTQLNEYVRRTLAADPMLHHICLSGEISNLKQQFSGHWYFSLKDENAAISCVMFRQSNMTVRFRPENGMKVKLIGSVGLYTKSGSYQFYADSMEQDGLGDLYLRFEALKNRLMAQGLFDPSIKKQLPMLPRGVGVVTSATGAVIHDICRVTWRRFPGMPVFLCPVKVQGEGAAEEIAQGIALMDRLEAVDVIIVGRGGGSMEDLWAFNEEIVARAVYACQKPVISAVGHETDYTICDFTSDVRAATPSAAAELAVPLKSELQNEITESKNHFNRLLLYSVDRKQDRINQLRARIRGNSPKHRLEAVSGRISGAEKRMEYALSRRLSELQIRLQKAALQIQAASPQEVLKRGYAIVEKNGKPVHGGNTLQPGDQVRLLMQDTVAEAGILSVTNRTNE